MIHGLLPVTFKYALLLKKNLQRTGEMVQFFLWITLNRL